MFVKTEERVCFHPISYEHSQIVDGRNLFHKGQKVEHMKFGFGIVLGVSGDSAEIAFYKHGVKKIMIEFLKVA